MTINCPCCENEIEVTVDPGQKQINYPNRRAQPGYPPQVEDVIGCECWGCVEDRDKYENEVLERAWEEKEASRYAAIDHKIDEMRDEELMRGTR